MIFMHSNFNGGVIQYNCCNVLSKRELEYHTKSQKKIESLTFISIPNSTRY